MRISDWSSDVCSSDLAPASSSAGLGGVPPLGMKKTPSYFDVWMTSDAVLFPVSRSDMPAPFLTPNLLCWLGRRKSRSITRTFLPIRLRAMAVAKAQEDLPSPCLALVNIRLRGRQWDERPEERRV